MLMLFHVRYRFQYVFLYVILGVKANNDITISVKQVFNKTLSNFAIFSFKMAAKTHPNSGFPFSNLKPIV